MWDVKIHKVNKIEPIPNADRLEVAFINDWPIVVAKGVWQAGMTAVYIPYDSVLPANLIESLGLVGKLSGSKKNRVKAIRLRGQLSIGLLAPVPEGFAEGDSVAEFLGITKYEEPEDNSTGTQPRVMGLPKPPGWIKYDIDNCKNTLDGIIDGDEVVMLEKVHGCLKINTPILMSNNETKFIQDIKTGDTVKSFNLKTKQFEDKKVLNLIKSGKSDKVFWIKFLLENQKEIICTHNHKFLTQKGWVEAIHLTENDEIISY